MKYVSEVTDPQKIKDLLSKAKQITYTVALRYIGVTNLSSFCEKHNYAPISKSIRFINKLHIRNDYRTSYYKEPWYGVSHIYILVSKTLYVFK